MHDMNDDIEIETGTAGTGMKETMETAETGNAGVTRNQGADAAHPVVVRVPTDDDMRELGRRVALLLHGGGFCFQHFHHLVSGGVGRPLLEKARHHKDCVAYPRFGHAVRAAGRAFVSLGVGHRQISFPASSRFSCSIFPCAAAFLKFSPVKQRGEHISSRRS